MKRNTKRLVLDLLARGKVMTFATVRPDGYPQATTVTYANDGLTLFFACDRDCQKTRNLARSRKVSLTVNGEIKDWKRIQGLSMGATAEVATRPAEVRRGLALLGRKYPAMAELSPEDLEQTAVVKVTPRVISIIDYTRGFGHTDLVRVGRPSRRSVR
jgi:hypothetical protein